MKAITEHTGTLEILDRLPNSYYGNPRYLARVDGVTFRTRPDASQAYSLPNHTGKRVKVQIGTYYGKATLHALWSI